MPRYAQRAVFIAVTALLGSLPAQAQETVGKRLSAIVGVAVEEYGKGVDANGRVFAQLEVDEATGFLREALEVSNRLTSPTAPAVREAISGMLAATSARARPDSVRVLYAGFVTALGADGALDLPSGPINLARGKAIYDRSCAACHGLRGEGTALPRGAPANALAPPAIGTHEIMRDATPALTYRIVSVGIQGTAMRGWSDSLSTDDRWNVVAYVNSLRSTDAERARGRHVVARVCADCDSTTSARQFGWLAQRSDADLVAMLRSGDPASGVPAAAPVSASEADAIVAALRADAIVAPTPASGASDEPRAVARRVLGIVDAAVVATRSGRRVEAADHAFDAYIAFEPLESNARLRDPALVARLERHFADLHSAVKAGDAAAADRIRTEIELGMPAVLELTAPMAAGWGTFVESLLIILREGFEAILVVGAIVAFLIKTGNRRRLREIWIGVGAGLVASAVLAVILRTMLANAAASREVIEGATMLVAVVVLFSVSYWLLSKVEGEKWQQFIRAKVSDALDRGGSTALGFVAFLAVFREGAETALFFQALAARSSGALPAIVGGIAAGGALLAVIFTLFYQFGIRIPLRPFFGVTSGLLYWMALVFAGKGVKELQEGGAMSRTLVPAGPHVDILGVYPTVETLLAQGLLVALLLFAIWRTFLTPPLRQAAVEAAAEPDRSEAAGEAVPPEVAARLAELQVTAKRLQDRVTSLEREVEHDGTKRHT